MCLAVPGRVIQVHGDRAWVDFLGNRCEVCMALTPGAKSGDWVLVHAGFAITAVDEAEALDTWRYLAREDVGEMLGDSTGTINRTGPSSAKRLTSAGVEERSS